MLAREQELCDSGQPADMELMFRRLELLHKLRRWKEAIETGGELLELLGDSDDSMRMETLILISRSHAISGNPKIAMEQCRQAEQLQEKLGLPENPWISYNYEMVYRQLGRYEDALAASREAERRFIAQGLPVWPGVWANRGILFSNLGRLEEALEAYDETDRQFSAQGLPPFAGNAVNRSAIFMHMGRYEEALAALDEAERRFIEQGQPVFHGIFAHRGEVHAMLGNYRMALLSCDEAERMAAENGVAADPATEILRARCLGYLGRYEDALEAYARAEKLAKEQDRGDNWGLYFSRAVTHHKAGNMSEAGRDIYRAILTCGKLGIEASSFLLETLQDWLVSDTEGLVSEQHASQPEAVQPVPDNEKKHDVFICYRREPSLANSMLLQAHMEIKQKTVFRDQEGLSSGRFEDGLQDAIRYSRHMVLLLSPGFFSRCMDEKDVVRKEIATALHSGTHIIPVMMEGFEWPAEDELPEDIRAVKDINAMSWSTEFFTAFIDKLLKWME